MGGGQFVLASPPLQILGGTCPPPVIYAHVHVSKVFNASKQTQDEFYKTELHESHPTNLSTCSCNIKFVLFIYLNNKFKVIFD